MTQRRQFGQSSLPCKFTPVLIGPTLTLMGDGFVSLRYSRGLNGVSTQDLEFFTRLTYLDVGENELKIESLAGLAALRELVMPCNAMQSAVINKGDFQHMQHLDLSFIQCDAPAP